MSDQPRHISEILADYMIELRKRAEKNGITPEAQKTLDQAEKILK